MNYFFFKSLKKQTVRIKGYNLDKKVTINISDAYVVEQAALNLGDPEAYDYPSLFLDFGGGTFDASYWVLDEKGMPHRTKKLSDFPVPPTAARTVSLRRPQNHGYPP